jgi:hypothetical protein
MSGDVRLQYVLTFKNDWQNRDALAKVTSAVFLDSPCAELAGEGIDNLGGRMKRSLRRDSVRRGTAVTRIPRMTD